MISPTDRRDSVRAAGLFAFASTVIVCLLWLPFGFGMVGHIEEWDILGLFTRHGVFFFAGEHSPLPTHRLRPLTAAPNAVAYLLTPDSFVGMHLLQMGALILKGLAASLMVFWLLRSRWIAVLAGLLMIVWPADTMQLSFRSYHINWAVALGMAGVAGLLYAYERRESLGSGGVVLALLSSLSLAIAALIYEAALIFVPLPYLLLWARHGIRRAITITLGQWQLTLMWGLSVALCLGYIYSVLAHGSTYQSNLVGGQSTGLQMLKERLAVFAFTGFGRSLLGGWIDAAMILAQEFRTYLYVAATAVILAATLAWSSRPSYVAGQAAVDDHSVSRRSLCIRALLAGLFMVALGYLPFLTSPAHMAISQRTFLFATFGAVLATVALLALLPMRRGRVVGVLAGTVLTTLGLAAQMFQFQHYQEIADAQRRVLASVMATTPEIGPDKHVVLLDGSERAVSVWMLRDNMPAALTYLYGSPVNSVQICTQPGNYWQHLDEHGRPGRCTQTPSGWLFNDGPTIGVPGGGLREPKLRIEIANESALLDKINADGTTVAAPGQLARLERGEDTLSRRYAGVVRDRTWSLAIDQFRRQQPRESYRYDFGRWWSLEQAPHGRGWRDAEWFSSSKFEKVSAAWANMTEASLVFDLAPRNSMYMVKGRIHAIAPGVDPDGISIAVNGRPAHGLNWINPNEFYTYVPAGEFTSGRNEIVFHTPVDMDFYGWAISMDWVRIAPQQ